MAATLGIVINNSDNSIVHTKDRLLDMLARKSGEGVSEDKMLFLDNAELVLFVLDTTTGMFAECNYAYKGKEIAQIVADRCFEFLGHCQHAMTIRRIEIVRNRARTLVDRFHALQQARMDPAWPDNLLNKSNLELAS